jgi:hypothetical protein
MYKLAKNLLGEVDKVLKEEDNFLLSIPFDPANTQYQEYLKWVAEGNTPQPAEE